VASQISTLIGTYLSHILRGQVGPTLRSADVGLSEERYAAFLDHMFGLSVQPGQDWMDLVPGVGCLADEPLSLVERQLATVVAFSRSGTDLLDRDRSALFVGLIAYCSTAFSGYAYDFVEADRDIVLPYLWSMRYLWRDLFARLAIDPSFNPRSGGADEQIVYLAFMWFDLWSPPKVLETDVSCRDALWDILVEMLDSGNRVCEAAAWHGVAHLRELIDSTRASESLVDYLQRCQIDDPMRGYAELAVRGAVL